MILNAYTHYYCYSQMSCYHINCVLFKSSSPPASWSAWVNALSSKCACTHYTIIFGSFFVFLMPTIFYHCGNKCDRSNIDKAMDLIFILLSKNISLYNTEDRKETRLYVKSGFHKTPLFKQK